MTFEREESSPRQIDDKRASFLELIFGKDLDLPSSAKRINISTRVSTTVVDVLDALIELGAFSSRSEAVATYLEYIIHSKLNLYQELIIRAERISNMRDSAIDLNTDLFERKEET